MGNMAQSTDVFNDPLFVRKALRTQALHTTTTTLLYHFYEPIFFPRRSAVPTKDTGGNIDFIHGWWFQSDATF